MYKFLGSINAVESHNKLRPSDLALEKVWVTHCGWLRLCKTVAMVSNITNYWELFRYGVNRYHNEKSICIREFS